MTSCSERAGETAVGINVKVVNHNLAPQSAEAPVINAVGA
jgi:hypothetical protein